VRGRRMLRASRVQMGNIYVRRDVEANEG